MNISDLLSKSESSQIDIIDDVDYKSNQIELIDEVDYKSNQIDIDKVNYESSQIDIINENYKLCGMACKHIFSVCQKFYPMPASEVSFFQVKEPEPEETVSVSFEDWVDRNQMTAADLEAIVNAGMKRKTKIAMYDNCPIPGFEL
ncbi:44729_t:CDS:2, partial [Gigaspora margarita]